MNSTHKLPLFLLATFLLTVITTPVFGIGLDVSLNIREFELTPGQSNAITFSVTNKSGKDQRYRIAIKPLTAPDVGVIEGVNPRKRQVPDWFSTAPSQIQVDSGASKNVQLKAAIPDKPGLEGTYYAQVYVRQLLPARSIAKQLNKSRDGDNAGGVGIRHRFQFAFPVRVNVKNNPGEANIKVNDIRFDTKLVPAENDAGKQGRKTIRTMQIDLDNHGTKMTKYKGRVIFEPYDQDGKRVRVNIDGEALWPKRKRTVTLTLPDKISDNTHYRAILLLQGLNKPIARKVDYNTTTLPDAQFDQ